MKTLYKRDSKEKIRVWNVWTEGNKVFTEFGVQGGKMQISTVTCEPKNIGKSNEVSPEEQAVLEAERLYTKKSEEGYSNNLDDLSVSFKPMLAHTYKDQEVEGWLGQPKLDGFRCTVQIVNGDVKYFTRTNKPIETLGHLTPSILSSGLQEGEILDGEAYLHNVPFEKLSSYIKKNHLGDPLVEFHIFDLVTKDDLPFKNRWENLSQLKFGDFVKIVDTWVVEDLEQDLSDWLTKGYEGIMLRNPNSKYINRRSRDLLKVKNFHDDEFIILEVNTGRGKFEGVPIFKCQTLDGLDSFDCVLAGSRELMTDLLNRKDLIGKQLTVKFQNISELGKPRFPVGIRIREE